MNAEAVLGCISFDDHDEIISAEFIPIKQKNPTLSTPSSVSSLYSSSSSSSTSPKSSIAAPNQMAQLWHAYTPSPFITSILVSSDAPRAQRVNERQQQLKQQQQPTEEAENTGGDKKTAIPAMVDVMQEPESPGSRTITAAKVDDTAPGLPDAQIENSAEKKTFLAPVTT
jgi:hypothetical protein